MIGKHLFTIADLHELQGRPAAKPPRRIDPHYPAAQSLAAPSLPATKPERRLVRRDARRAAGVNA
jgi:hypothetical protein